MKKVFSLSDVIPYEGYGLPMMIFNEKPSAKKLYEIIKRHDKNFTMKDSKILENNLSVKCKFHGYILHEVQIL